MFRIKMEGSPIRRLNPAVLGTYDLFNGRAGLGRSLRRI